MVIRFESLLGNSENLMLKLVWLAYMPVEEAEKKKKKKKIIA